MCVFEISLYDLFPFFSQGIVRRVSEAPPPPITYTEQVLPPSARDRARAAKGRADKMLYSISRAGLVSELYQARIPLLSML